MARKSKNRTSLRYPAGRDLLNPRSLTKRLPRRILVRSSKQLLLDNARLFGQDNRAYTPIRQMIRPARTVTGRIALEVLPKRKPLNRVKFRFQLPKQTTICVRRSVRKEVLHAIGKTGRGVRKRHPRRNQWSSISC